MSASRNRANRGQRRHDAGHRQSAFPARRSLASRLLWFVALWLAGLIVVGGGTYALRALIGLLY